MRCPSFIRSTSTASTQASRIRPALWRWWPLLALASVVAAVGADSGWPLLAMGVGLVGLVVVDRSRAAEVTWVTSDPSLMIAQAWSRLDQDVRAAEADETTRESVLQRYLRDVARARRRHATGHGTRALPLTLAAEAHYQLEELETAAMLGCELVEELPGAPLALQLRAFTVLASIERDADGPFGRAGVYGWLREKLANEPVLTRAHWALTGGALAEEHDQLEAAAHRYSEALELLEGPAAGSPYRGRMRSNTVEVDADLVLEVRTRLGTVLVRMGAFEAAYEIERELECRELEPGVHRWIRRRMAHHAHNLGDYDEARQRLMSLVDSSDDDCERARLLAALAVVERDAGRLDAAHQAATSAYVLEAVQQVASSSDTVAILARLELELERRTIAASLVDELRAGPERVAHAGLMQVEALVAADRGAHDVARSRAEQAVALAIDEHGENHPFVTDALHTLGLILLRGEHRHAALGVLSKAVRIVEARTDRQHPRLVRLLDTLAQVETDASAASRLRARVQEICTRHGLRAPARV